MPTERSAFLKAHLLPEFMAGLIAHDPGMYPRRLIVEECRLFGVPVLGPDVQRSRRDADVVVLTADEADARLGLTDARRARRDGCDPVPHLPAGWTWPVDVPDPLPPTGRDAGRRPDGGRWAVRLGLAEVAELSHEERDRILAARPLSAVTELRDRVGVGRDGALALVGSGALDGLAGLGTPGRPRDRRELRLLVEEVWSAAGRRRGRRATGSEGAGAQVALPLPLEDAPMGLPAQPSGAVVREELRTTGIDLSAHVVSFYAPLLAALDVVDAAAFRDVPTGTRVRVAGVRVALQSPPQRSGDRVLFLTLDDRTGQVQVTFFARALPDCAWVVRSSELVVAEGVVARRGRRGATLVGRRAWDLTRLWRAWQDGALPRALAERGTPEPHVVALRSAGPVQASARGSGGRRGSG